jgi:hypothetical protein
MDADKRRWFLLGLVLLLFATAGGNCLAGDVGFAMNDFEVPELDTDQDPSQQRILSWSFEMSEKMFGYGVIGGPEVFSISCAFNR